MLSIIFQSEGLTDWWKPNQTSLPPPRGLEHPSDAVKKDRPTGVYLGMKKIKLFGIQKNVQLQELFIYQVKVSASLTRLKQKLKSSIPHRGQMSHHNI